MEQDKQSTAAASTSFSFLSGLSIGMLLMYFLDPRRGARRRALVRDKAVSAAGSAYQFAEKKSRHLKNELSGLGHNIAEKFSAPESITDEKLSERVRSELGRVVSSLSNINISARAGEITLEGSVSPEETEKLIKAAREVRGVKKVVNNLHPIM